MRLDYTYGQLAGILSEADVQNDTLIQSVAFDSRRISNGQHVLFFALEGVFRDGHDFIKDAYLKGVRHFVVRKKGYTDHLEGAHEIVVSDVFQALQTLASHHRNRFSCSVVAITGSNGKTTVKEWLSQLLSAQYNVARSPKSYNSKLGVSISLLELSERTEIAIIEVGVPEKGDMPALRDMIRPTHGIFTSFGSDHRVFFESEDEHLSEKLSLFEKIESFIYPVSVEKLKTSFGTPIADEAHADILRSFPIHDGVSKQNARLAIDMAIQLGMDTTTIQSSVGGLNPLALRLESYEGINGNVIINDTYSLDNDSLRLSLEYQLANSNGKERIVLIGLPEKDEKREAEITSIIAAFAPEEYRFHYLNDPIDYSYENASILIKGTRSSRMERVARTFRQQNHQTYLEIDLTVIRHNILAHRAQLLDNTRLLCMVKASSYGSDPKTMGKFLEGLGIDYLGVAYADEGIELRESGVQLPILVMNCEESSFTKCIEHNLEPAFFGTAQLNSFIRELISQGKSNYPIHLKLETGMNRLGFSKDELPALMDLIKGQPEIVIQSLYSHLAESDIEKSEFTKKQIDTFNLLSDQIENELAYSPLRHILNSSGIQNYPSAQLDMVRLGIGMYGTSEHEQLRPAIAWYSSISQVKKVTPGESVGYSRSFIADKEMTIAIIPVGYADGFRRSLGQGIGGVYIHNQFCPTVGNVCMDMIMVDVSHLHAVTNDPVEIIGKHQSIGQFAKMMGTIPYEVMTNFSPRVHRVFIDQ